MNEGRTAARSWEEGQDDWTLSNQDGHSDSGQYPGGECQNPAEAHEEQALIIDHDNDADLFTEDSETVRLRSMVIAELSVEEMGLSSAKLESTK